eukprot:CAMPEP_0198254164 /NCGR_PEP_ID=MMETSP1447-20131203/4529_1 /TAXON_ID=420782 /ORGANISM="Chaetoceros dichaeta, Strain CCMP1751" /LENGTH=624 /DNA_ID=CAMNT_0043940127 /DNA_START=25 /DNA_END=1899 /DNA_ORIENTATION=+
MTGPKLPRDSVLAYIPLTVTADLGVAMRRVRPKRIARLKSLYPSLFEKKNELIGASGTTAAAEDSGAEVSRSDGDESDNEKSSHQKRKKEETEPLDISRVPQRDQFGSVLDYLEAKYVKGVMIEDLDERIRQKKKQRKKQVAQAGDRTSMDKNGSDVENNMSVLSDSAAGSCYSDDSGGFINDSELQSEVAQQVRASSAYGTTKIEAEAAANRKEKTGDANDDDGGSDDDHAFFVNVGDLEMEDGYVDNDFDEVEGWMDTAVKEKGKKRKRAPKDNLSPLKETLKSKPSVKKSKKEINEKPKKLKSKSNSKKTQASKNTENTNQTVKSEKPKKKKKMEKDIESNESDTEPLSDVVQGKKADAKEKEPKKADAKEKEPKKTLKMTLIDVAKKEATELKKKSNKLYKKCVVQIKKMKEEHLPRKPKSGGKVKVSITVPANKKGGDSITFSNPHFPSQKLKVKIPENSKPGKSFKVSVPMPKVSKSPSNSQNKFTKSVTNALDEYSKAYDDWCQAEAKHRTLQPKRRGGKIEQFKAGVERLKKYDEMLEEFPNNLVNPIDAIFIRKLVRRTRQNEKKRMKAIASTGDVSESPKKNKVNKVITLAVPGKGVTFPSVPFNDIDFERIDI